MLKEEVITATAGQLSVLSKISIYLSQYIHPRVNVDKRFHKAIESELVCLGYLTVTPEGANWNLPPDVLENIHDWTHLQQEVGEIFRACNPLDGTCSMCSEEVR